MNAHKLHIAIPVLGEYANIHSLFSYLAKQSYSNFHIYVCVNQYESWWNDPAKDHYCTDNARSLEYLNALELNNLTVIDKSSRGNGWPDKKGGVGRARKTLMDSITREAQDGLIVSMDADTRYPDNYLEKINLYFLEHPDKVGLSVPYYHYLDNEETDRYILRYEIYMRYYALNMLRIRNPYAFTALGSAIVVPLWAYRKIGGMTPVKSGEDFYLLQKLVKTGELGQWADTTAFPSPRFSDRVLFGTGPAIIKGSKGDWSSYPLYQPEFFNMIEETYRLFPVLYSQDVQTPMTPFLRQQFKTGEIWKPLRDNYKDLNNFVKACANKVDGLRILQFLRVMNATQKNIHDETVLRDYLQAYFETELNDQLKEILRTLDFEKTGVEDLNKIRNFLFNKEMNLRKLSENW